MKELTIEEKAKAYDEAIKETSAAYKDEDRHLKAVLERIFPTFKESEDEKIRKGLIDYFSNFHLQTFADIDPKKILIWLEKQGEQKHETPIPRFNIGDWVIVHNKDAYQVIGVNTYDYRLQHYLGGKMNYPFKYESDLKPWTIQDAKDGDVLVDKSDGTIGIFQSIGHHPDGGSYNDPSYCFLHCRYDDGYFYADFENGNTMSSDDAIPATKEQHDLLFQKIHEAGYTFDFEKKELRKIEQEHTWSEEDEYMIKNICNAFEKDSSQYIWLKSLRLQNRWKPSDAQMDSIACAVRKMKESACYDSELVSLHQDLKKLKEE